MSEVNGGKTRCDVVSTSAYYDESRTRVTNSNYLTLFSELPVVELEFYSLAKCVIYTQMLNSVENVGNTCQVEFNLFLISYKLMFSYIV